MRVLGIGGCSSGVGKTTLVCHLARSLPGWGVLKTSLVHRMPCPDPAACPRCSRLPDGFEIVTAPARLYRDGRDTGRYRSAGAARVIWLRTRPEFAGRGADRAAAMFQDLPGVIVEGNSFTRYLQPDRLVLVARADLDEVKPSARELIPRADAVVLNVPAGSGGDRSEAWRPRLVERHGARRVLEMDLASADDAGLAEFLAEVRGWFHGGAHSVGSPGPTSGFP